MTGIKTKRERNKDPRFAATAPARQQVPPGAQPGMTPVNNMNELRPPPPPQSENVRGSMHDVEYTTTDTVLDRLMPLMHVHMWHMFLALVTYAQLIDDLEAGNARMTPQYQGAILAPFIGFGPAHVWTGMQGDLKQTVLRIIDRWFTDADYRAAGGSLTWQMIDWLAPGFCQTTKGPEGKVACLEILREIKNDFV